MRIAYIYTALTTKGGVDRILTFKANYFAEQYGYEVYIITDSQAGRPPVFPLSSKVRHIDVEVDFDEQYHYGIVRRTLCYFRLMKRYKRKLRALLDELKPDFVLTTCGRDLDFLTDFRDGSLKIGESHIAKEFCRNFHLMEQRGFPYRQIARYWRKKQERAIKKLDAFVVLTAHDANSWASVKTAEIIPNPSPLNSTGCSSCQNKRIISVGRLSEQKGYDLLIDAWNLVSKRHPDWVLDIYGDGMLKESLSLQIREIGLEESLHLCPPISKISEKYQESSIYVMSSRFEGFGLVLIEAMSCGVPCVSFDCPYGPSEIIQDNEDGLLVQNGNVAQLAEKICYLIEHEDIRKDMGEKALINSQRYAPEQIMNRWIGLFESLKKQ